MVLVAYIYHTNKLNVSKIYESHGLHGFYFYWDALPPSNTTGIMTFVGLGISNVNLYILRSSWEGCDYDL